MCNPKNRKSNMQKLLLHIIALAHNEGQASSFVVLLKEEEGERRLPVVIGSIEAQAIASAVEGVKPNRPFTHDLLANTLKSFSVQIVEVLISDLRDNVFFATLLCSTPDGHLCEIDSRTSDALALAMRFDCPIYTYRHIMDKAGIIWDNPPEKSLTSGRRGLGSLSEEELQLMLEEALEEEHYERAAEIRDELERRKSN